MAPGAISRFLQSDKNSMLEIGKQDQHNPAMADHTPIIDLKGITFAYPGGPPVLRDLDFALCSGQRIGIMAPNGSGKTTLFHLIMGLVKPLTGQISIFGKAMRAEKDFVEARRRIGLLFQDPDDQLFSPTVLEDVAFGPLNLGKSREPRHGARWAPWAWMDSRIESPSNSPAAKNAWCRWRRCWPWSPMRCSSMNPKTGSTPAHGLA
jgi:ABC-type glutathione transport system ATPase component